MEADWSVEIGADLPAIVVPWESFADLRLHPQLAYSLNETVFEPILAQLLVRLNQEISPVFTSKCDLWLLPVEEIDPLEFEADKENSQHGIACYIDIIARSAVLFASFRTHELWVGATTDSIRQERLSQARVDLVVRSSNVDSHEGFAVTLYVAACGATENAARSVFQSALETAITITMKQATAMGE